MNTASDGARSTRASSQIRTLLVEDHLPFLHHLCSTLRQRGDLNVVAQAQNGLEAVALAQALQPDLVLLDIGLPGLNGIEAARRIRVLAPDTKILFLTQECSPDIVDEALSVGAWGYILKSSSTRDLPLALEAIIQGKKFSSEGLDRGAGVST